MKLFLKITVYVVSAFILFMVGFGIGMSGNKAIIDEKKMTISELDEEIEGLQKNKSQAEEELESLSKDKTDTEALISKKDETAEQLAELEAKLADVQATLDKELEEGRKEADEKLADLTAQIEEKQGELNTVTEALSVAQGKLQETGDDPIELSAGYYTVGTDLPSGRYTATPIGEGSNLFVNDGLKVNTILGDGTWGEPSYTFSVSEGDTIQTEARILLTPVE
ncbi:hypothetical protein N781_04875 [Pontibacillus halophilus JSM 076056 = DSM 19796]|uniref:Uncharacterized protein n=1 Tax=Pontibacillus halophilus JSM 076056 = DSM 19796 TaxID=1385510 RepID=A0A0A5GGE8_9BACI|nr:hypothetical protein [Pontibacillus halophilus]KGX91049.1 hypothetical protein N781_04875 [Pontibacillus halophilus JSM 076056 = DSM 19796]